MAVRKPLKLFGQNLQEWTDEEYINYLVNIAYHIHHTNWGPGQSSDLLIGQAVDPEDYDTIPDTYWQQRSLYSNISHPFSFDVPEPTLQTSNYYIRRHYDNGLVDPPADTNDTIKPVYYSSGTIQVMSLTDIIDTFIKPAMLLVKDIFPVKYYISTSTPTGYAHEDVAGYIDQWSMLGTVAVNSYETDFINVTNVSYSILAYRLWRLTDSGANNNFVGFSTPGIVCLDDAAADGIISRASNDTNLTDFFIGVSRYMITNKMSGSLTYQLGTTGITDTQFMGSFVDTRNTNDTTYEIWYYSAGPGAYYTYKRPGNESTTTVSTYSFYRGIIT